MHAMVGQDPEEVDALAAEFELRATELDATRTAIAARLGGSAWSGPDRDRFQSEWDGRLAGQVGQTADALRAAAHRAAASARDQRLASAGS